MRSEPEGFCPRPERVFALTTRLVLSPYSAAGEPDMISMDWIAFSGIEVEKTLLRWSDIGWPSITKLTCAWSPSGWKKPFESAATFGVVKVIASFSPDPGERTGSAARVR